MRDLRVYNNSFEMSQGVSVATAYSLGLVKGWNEELAAEAFKIVGSNPRILKKLPLQMISNAAGRKAFLYEITRKLLGQDTKNYPQQVGDCVSFGAKNAVEYLICCEKLMKGDREKFRPIFPPYLYGTGRVYVGGNRINGDGSLGSWMAEAVIKYGVIPADEPGVPNYSGSIARNWGSSRSALDKWKSLGQQHPVKSAAQIRSWSELVAAIVNGYPCTVASNQGFNMEPSSDGFHRASGSWAHQMTIIGADDEHAEPYALILNSWGDVHGHLTAFGSNQPLPVGVLRVKRATIERMINAGETFAFSSFDGFPEQELDEALFKIVGK